MQRPIIAGLIIIAIIVIGSFFYITSRTSKETGPGSIPIPRSEVLVGQNGFSPQTLTIKRGEAVVWINQSGQDATVNSDPHPTHKLHRFLNLGEFPDGSSVQANFEESGTYGYHNHLNPSQTGTIIVE